MLKAYKFNIWLPEYGGYDERYRHQSFIIINQEAEYVCNNKEMLLEGMSSNRKKLKTIDSEEWAKRVSKRN